MKTALPNYFNFLNRPPTNGPQAPGPPMPKTIPERTQQRERKLVVELHIPTYGSPEQMRESARNVLRQARVSINSRTYGFFIEEGHVDELGRADWVPIPEPKDHG